MPAISRYYFTLLFFICFCLPNAGAQDKQKMDSLMKVLETHQNDTAAIYAYCEIATDLLGTDDRLAKEYAYKGLELSQKLNKPGLESWAKNLIGLAYDYLGVPDSALLFYHGSIDIKRRLNDIDGLAATTLNIGVLYYYQNDLEKAIEYYKSALEMYTKVNNEKRIAGAYNNLGTVYREQKKYKEAIDMFGRAYALKVKTNDTTGMSNALGNLGIVYQHMHQYEKAEELMLRSLDLDILSDNKYNQLSSYVGLADLELLENNFAQTKQYLDKAIELGKGLDAAHYMDDAYKVYTKLDSMTGDFRSAYRHLQLQYEYSNKVIQEDRSKQMDRLETVYRTKEKEKEIDLLNANALIKNLQLQKQKKQTLTFVGISSLLLIGLILFVIGFRSIRKAKKQLQDKNEIINRTLEEKETLLKEIHHRVKNNLQVISSLLSVQSRYIKDEKALESINESMERVNAISVLHQEIYRNDVLRLINAKNYFENLAKGLQQTFDPGNKIKLELELDDVMTDIDQLLPLGLIVNELLTNAYKYGSTATAPSIRMSLQNVTDNIKIEVQDNGNGFGENLPGNTDNTLGYKLVNMFATKIKADLTVQNNNGAHITIACEIKNG